MVPCLLYSHSSLLRTAGPIGWSLRTRSKAWIPVFSSKQATLRQRGGLRFSWHSDIFGIPHPPALILTQRIKRLIAHDAVAVGRKARHRPRKNFMPTSLGGGNAGPCRAVICLSDRKNAV